MADPLRSYGLARRNGKDAYRRFEPSCMTRPELATVHSCSPGLSAERREQSCEESSSMQWRSIPAGRCQTIACSAESQSGRHQQARARLDDLLKQRPDDLAALDMLMMGDLVTKNWVEAERTLNRLRAVSKDSVVAFMAEGRLRQAQGQLHKASAAYERATALAPNDPEPLLSLVKLDVAQSHADRAKARLDALLAARPIICLAMGYWAGTGPQRHPQEADVSVSRGSRVNPNGSRRGSIGEACGWHRNTRTRRFR